MKILAIGDIHGRDFWKSPVKRYLKKVDKVIFLGDYCDPYQDEGEIYTWKDTANNFNEIIELKRNNMDKVILLLGNHDGHYYNKYFDDLARSTRFDDFHAVELRKMFNENAGLFQLCYIAENNGKKLIFTHAGVTNHWLNLCKIENDDNLEANINELKNSDEGFSKLAIIGRERTWFGEKTGSPLWCDVREFMRDKGLGDNIYQIFGHTRCEKGKFIETDSFACLDSQCAFRINDKNKIKRIEDETVKTNEKQRAVQDSQDDKPQ